MRDLTSRVGVVYSKLGADSRVLVKRAHQRARFYYRQFAYDVPVAHLVHETAE